MCGLHGLGGDQGLRRGSLHPGGGGFGGSFAVTHGKLSEGIGLEKLAQIEKSGVDQIVSGDMGCLAHLNGLISRNGIKLKTAHVAQVLAEAVGP